MLPGDHKSACDVGTYQALSLDVQSAKKSVLECVDLADKLQSSPVCSEVARVSLNKQIRDLETLSADVDDDWSRKRTELETELTHLEKYYSCYQVCLMMIITIMTLMMSLTMTIS